MIKMVLIIGIGFVLSTPLYNIQLYKYSKMIEKVFYDYKNYLHLNGIEKKVFHSYSPMLCTMNSNSYYIDSFANITYSILNLYRETGDKEHMFYLMKLYIVQQYGKLCFLIYGFAIGILSLLFGIKEMIFMVDIRELIGMDIIILIVFLAAHMWYIQKIKIYTKDKKIFINYLESKNDFESLKLVKKIYISSFAIFKLIGKYDDTKDEKYLEYAMETYMINKEFTFRTIMFIIILICINTWHVLGQVSNCLFK